MWGVQRSPQGAAGTPQKDAEAEEEGAEQSQPGEGPGTQQGSIEAAVRGRWGPALVCVCREGTGIHYKQLFNHPCGCQESPVRAHGPPLKASLCLQPRPAPATPLLRRWKNSPAMKAPCCTNSPGLVRALDSPARRLPPFLPSRAIKQPLCRWCC